MTLLCLEFPAEKASLSPLPELQLTRCQSYSNTHSIRIYRKQNVKEPDLQKKSLQ